MGLPHSFNGNWERYWNNFDDLNQLKEFSSDMDSLLHQLEEKLQTKLLAKDHFEIIDAIENRIEELEQQQSENQKSSVGVQGQLFVA